MIRLKAAHCILKVRSHASGDHVNRTAAIVCCLIAYLVFGAVFMLVRPHFRRHGAVTPEREKHLIKEVMTVVSAISDFAEAHHGELPSALADVRDHLHAQLREEDALSSQKRLDSFLYIRRDPSLLMRTSAVPILLSRELVPVRRILVGTYPLPAAIPHTREELRIRCVNDAPLSNVVAAFGGLDYMFGLTTNEITVPRPRRPGGYDSTR